MSHRQIAEYVCGGINWGDSVWKLRMYLKSKRVFDTRSVNEWLRAGRHRFNPLLDHEFFSSPLPTDWLYGPLNVPFNGYHGKSSES